MAYRSHPSFFSYVRDCLNQWETSAGADGEGLFTYLNSFIKGVEFGFEWMDSSSSKKENLYWAHPTGVHVIEYILRLQSDLGNFMLSNMIASLELLVSQNKHILYKYIRFSVINEDDEVLLKIIHHEIFEKVESLVLPEIRKVFTNPQLNLHISVKQISFHPNKCLVSFIDFLLEILWRAAAFFDWGNGDEDEILSQMRQRHHDAGEQIRYALIRDELTFISTILGDRPFWHPGLQEVNILLPQFEIIAIQAGKLIYSCLFENLLPALFDERKNAFLENIELLKANIKQHSLKFSHPPNSVTTSTDNPIDSLCILDSILEGLERLMDCKHDFAGDGVVVLIKRLQDELRLCVSVLRSLKVSQDSHINELRESLLKIRDIAYEIEYLINSYRVGNLPIWYLNHRLPHVISEIKPTRERLRDISENYGIATYYFRREPSVQPSLDSLVVDDERVVGFEDNGTKILKDLVSGSKKLKMISIVGMPGIGKTTTAKKLYDATSICNYFGQRGWCVVTQAYNKRRVLIDVLRSATDIPKDDPIWKEDVGILGKKIHQSLTGRRYLIVVDDVWESKSLDDLKKYFPDNAKGSRILLTSRIQNVAPKESSYSLSLLSEVQSWELLEKRVFLKESCPPKLLEIGKALVANCRGLPLAIVVTAGILSNVKKEESEWEKVKKQLNVSLLDDSSAYRKILELSYENLPDYLKLCFLYLGVFPEGSEIQVRKLVLMWIAEGFIQKTDRKNQEEVAREYLVDLVKRNLLVISRRRSYDGIKTCMMHDLLREMCVKRAEEENFMKCIKGDDYSIFSGHKRLYVPCTPAFQGYLGRHFRTIVGHVSYQTYCVLQMTDLRVMDTQQMENRNFTIKDLKVPPNLRYLGHDQMPNFIKQDFSNIEFLDVNNDLLWSSITPAILNMVKLRYLRVKTYGEFAEDCDGTQTNNLEYLSRVAIDEKKDEEILKCCTHLRRLSCTCLYSIIPDFSSFTELVSLKVSGGRDFTEVNFPSTIKKLSLRGFSFPWEKMSTLGRLPQLEILKLDERSFIGDEWITRDDEFLMLKFLKLEMLDVKFWIADCDHFPKLQKLELCNCPNLQEIPSDFGDHMILHTINVDACNEETNASAALIGEKQQENGNEEFRVIVKKKATRERNPDRMERPYVV